MATHVLCRGKRTFPYADDGLSVVFLEPGGEHLLDAGCVPGLVAEGWVEVAVAKPAKPR